MKESNYEIKTKSTTKLLPQLTLSDALCSRRYFIPFFCPNKKSQKLNIVMCTELLRSNENLKLVKFHEQKTDTITRTNERKFQILFNFKLEQGCIFVVLQIVAVAAELTGSNIFFI